MGNQEVRQAMRRIQRNEFDASQLETYEKAIWTAQELSEIERFRTSTLNIDNNDEWQKLHVARGTLDVKKSGLESDEKRYA